MKEVHGIDIGRKPPTRARKNSAIVRDYKYLAWIRSLPCAACGMERASEAAHTGSDGGMRIKASDTSCIPLCPRCHRTGSKAYHTIGRPAFEREHGLDIDALVAQLSAGKF
jgi:cytochrome c553